MASRGVFYGVVVVMVVLLIITSSLAVVYYTQYSQAESQNRSYAQQLQRLGVMYSSDIMFDFGNGTRIWHNDTLFQPGTNMYAATQILTGGRINDTYYPKYSEHLITALYNVGSSGNDYWGLWAYNDSAWQMPTVGADLILVANNSVFAWAYGTNSGSRP
jgi:type II secretory pathway pseudopilin PulG